MISVKTAAGFGVVGLLLAGCGAYDVEAIRKIEQPTGGTAFSRALTSEYRSLALFESDKMNDWPDSGLIARKGLAASKGNEVEPENPDDWSLRQAKLAELAQARQQLVAVLPRGKTEQPAIAAKAQASYDCWVEQEEEAWQTVDIATCRGNFERALAQLTPRPAPPPPPVTAPAVPAPTEWVVYFGWSKDKLDGTAQGVIQQAAADAKAHPETQIAIAGHADRSGSTDFNQRLSLRRADAVRAALIRMGIAADRISVTALGETQSAVVTADGVREARNRRVVITIR